MDGAAEIEESEFSLEEIERPSKKSLITQLIDSHPSSRNLSLEEAKKRVSAVVNLNVADF